jgi:hypothetical protein
LNPTGRAYSMAEIKSTKYVTVEPIIDFDLAELVGLIKMCNPVQVNIGADSMRCGLPEPSWDKVESLVSELYRFTSVHLKKNIYRLKGKK